MKDMKVRFRFRKITSELFGDIYRPYADVLVIGKHGKPRMITMVVDTGADYTLFPRQEAVLLGIDVERDCVAQTTYGVGGPQTVYLYQGLEVAFGGHQLKVPAGFLNTNEVPPLLGRHGFMELFTTCFEKRVVSFEK